MLTCAPQYDNNTTVESAHGRYNAPKTWLIVNTTFTYSYYERLHTDYLDKRNLPKLIIRLVLSILPQYDISIFVKFKGVYFERIWVGNYFRRIYKKIRRLGDFCPF